MGGFFSPQPPDNHRAAFRLHSTFSEDLRSEILLRCRHPSHRFANHPKHIAPHVSRLTSLFPQTKQAKRQRKNPPEQCSWRGGVVCLCRRMCFENANIIPKATRLCKQKKHLTRKSASEPSGESLRRHVLRRAPSLPSPHVHPPPRCSTTLRQHPKAFPLQNVFSLKHVFPIKIPKKKSSATTVRPPQKRRQRTFQPHVCALPGNSPHASHSLSATLTLHFAHLHSQSRRDSLAISPMLKMDAARTSKQLRERVILTLRDCLRHHDWMPS